MVFSKTIPIEINVTQNQKPSSPSNTVKNPLQTTSFINQIQIFPSSNFASNGVIQIFVNNTSQFHNIGNAGFFKKYKMFSVQLQDKKLNKNSKIEIFAWNPTDGTLIKADIFIFISDVEDPILIPSVPNQQSEFGILDVTDEGTKTTPDSGSGILTTIYTCPANKIATIKKLQTRVRNTGSADIVHLRLRGTRIATWRAETTLNPDTGASNEGSYGNPRKVWLIADTQEWNQKYDDAENEVLVEGETIAYDGDFSGNFNASVDFAYTIEEKDV